MTVGMIAYLIAAVIFFLSAVNQTILPNASAWGMFCIALGLLLEDYDLNFRRRR